jgi:ATP-binding cassette, subfamily B, bacterial
VVIASEALAANACHYEEVSAATPLDPPRPGRLLLRVLRLLRPYRRRASLLATAIIVGGLTGVAAPVLTKAVFDNALFPPGGEPRLGLLAVLVSTMVVLIAVSGVLIIVQTYLASRIGQDVMHDLRDQLFRHLQRMSLSFFTGTRTGEIQSRIMNDVGGVGSVISKGAPSVVGNAFFLLASLAAMAVLAWELAVLTLPILVLLVYVAYRVGRVKRQLSRSTQETLAEMSSIAQETLSVSGALLTRVFDRQREVIEHHRAESRRLGELRVRQEMVGRVFLGLVQTFFLVAPALMYLGAGILMSSGSARFTAGTLVAFTALQIRLFTPLRDLLDTYLQMQTASALFERVFQYLDLPHEIADSPRARALPKDRVRGEIAFRNVWFRYGSPPQGAVGDSDRRREWTLEGIELEVEPGQLVALVGPTGAGKTTLSYLIARLYDVDRGEVTIDGVDVRAIRLASLAEIIGMVTQETYLLHSSVRENLLYARPEATQEEVEAAARLAFIHERIVELDDGYDTIVGERGYRMSGGEKQRLAIARVVLKDPRILVLDEATSALDATSERLVQRALQPLIAGRTTIAIAHRLSTVLAADRIFVIDQGRVVERGKHDELVERGGLYARLYAQQFQSGVIEARTGDGIVLASGETVAPGEA